MYKNKNKFRI